MKPVCRLCLSPLGGGIKSASIFPRGRRKFMISSMIMSLTSAKIHHKDGLTKKICLCCLKKLHELHRFKKIVEASDMILHLSQSADDPSNAKIYIDGSETTATSPVADDKEPSGSQNPTDTILGKNVPRSQTIRKLRQLCSKDTHRKYFMTIPKRLISTCELYNDLFIHKNKTDDHCRLHLSVKPSAKHTHYLRTLATKIRDRSHTGVKPYSCEICGKDFEQLGCIQRHMKKHVRESHLNYFVSSHHLCKKIVSHPSNNSPQKPCVYLKICGDENYCHL